MLPIPANQLTKTRVRLCGSNAHSCGYCKSKDGASVSFGIVSDNMTANDYEQLMLIGWRRCGTYFYKPTMHKTCCPSYTIRLRVNEVKFSKSQRKVVKNVERFLASSIDDGRKQDVVSSLPAASSSASIISDNYNESNSRDTSCPTSIEPSTFATKVGKSRELSIDMELSSFTDEKFDLYRRYQIEVHKETPSSVTKSGFTRFLVTSSLNNAARSQFQSSGGSERGVASSSYSSCAPTASSPVHRIWSSLDTDTTSSSTPRPFPYDYGSYHQLYRLDGELIAVGVLDILSSGVSSVYLYYNNAYRHLVLGKYTAIKEIEFCRRFSFPYYYMGFYIHSCEKMRYKGEYRPSDLLCPTTLQWYPFEHCSALLNKFAFTPFEPALAASRALISGGEFKGIIPQHRSEDGKSERKSNEASASNTIAASSTVANKNESNCLEGESSEGGGKGMEKLDVSGKDEDVDSDEEREVPTEGALDAFAPQFSFQQHPGEDRVNRVPVDVGHSAGCLFLEHFGRNGEAVRSLLQDWVGAAGESATKIPVSFN